MNSNQQSRILLRPDRDVWSCKASKLHGKRLMLLPPCQSDKHQKVGATHFTIELFIPAISSDQVHEASRSTSKRSMDCLASPMGQSSASCSRRYMCNSADQVFMLACKLTFLHNRNLKQASHKQQAINVSCLLEFNSYVNMPETLPSCCFEWRHIGCQRMNQVTYAEVTH